MGCYLSLWLYSNYAELFIMKAISIWGILGVILWMIGILCFMTSDLVIAASEYLHRLIYL